MVNIIMGDGNLYKILSTFCSQNIWNYLSTTLFYLKVRKCDDLKSNLSDVDSGKRVFKRMLDNFKWMGNLKMVSFCIQ